MINTELDDTTTTPIIEKTDNTTESKSLLIDNTYENESESKIRSIDQQKRKIKC